MEINSPDEFMNAIKLLIMQMNRPQRKQFLAWVKRTRNAYDFKYPEGYKIEEKEPVHESKVESVITVPNTELIVPANDGTSSGIIGG